MIQDFTIHVYMLKMFVRILIEFVNLKEYYSETLVYILR